MREGKYDHKIRLEYVNIFQRVVVDNIESYGKSVSKNTTNVGISCLHPLFRYLVQNVRLTLECTNTCLYI